MCYAGNKGEITFFNIDILEGEGKMADHCKKIILQSRTRNLYMSMFLPVAQVLPGDLRKRKMSLMIVFSLTVHDKLNLQQEFSETTDHATNIPAHNKNRFRCQHQATRESNLESDSSKLPCVWSVYDAWNRSMIDSPEACLRRRLL